MSLFMCVGLFPFVKVSFVDVLPPIVVPVTVLNDDIYDDIH